MSIHMSIYMSIHMSMHMCLFSVCSPSWLLAVSQNQPAAAFRPSVRACVLACMRAPASEPWGFRAVGACFLCVLLLGCSPAPQHRPRLPPGFSRKTQSRKNATLSYAAAYRTAKAQAESQVATADIPRPQTTGHGNRRLCACLSTCAGTRAGLCARLNTQAMQTVKKKPKYDDSWVGCKVHV